MNKPGLITEIDAALIQEVLRKKRGEIYLYALDPSITVKVLEIGVHRGDTSRFIRDTIISIEGTDIEYTGIDNQHDFAMGAPFPGANFIIGNSQEVYHQLEDNSFDFIFVDGCHNLPSVVMDFLLYKDKVKHGGYILFHDTAEHISPFQDYQGSGDKGLSDNYISARKALTILGLYEEPEKWGFELYKEVADVSSKTGGITAFKRIE